MSTIVSPPVPPQAPSVWRRLAVANIVMLVTLLLHDLDHERQISTLCLKIETWQKVATWMDFLPNVVALWLCRKRVRYASHASVFAAVSIGPILVAHLIGGPAVMGTYSLSYWDLGVDRLSWAALWVLMATCVYTGVVGIAAFKAGR